MRALRRAVKTNDSCLEQYISQNIQLLLARKSSDSVTLLYLCQLTNADSYSGNVCIIVEIVYCTRWLLCYGNMTALAAKYGIYSPLTPTSGFEIKLHIWKTFETRTHQELRDEIANVNFCTATTYM